MDISAGTPAMRAETTEIAPAHLTAALPRNEIRSVVFTPTRFAALLALLLLAAFPEVILVGKTFFFRDFTLFGYPLAHYHREAFWHGELPLWNPLNNCGIPYMAQWNTMVFYPFSLIYLLLPLPWSLSWF